MSVWHKSQIAKSFGGAAASYDQHAQVQAKIGELLMSWVSPAQMSSSLIVDLGCGTGVWTQALAKLHPACQVKGVDFLQA